MKFGKRLASEASRRWSASYLDYKGVKKALYRDVETEGELRNWRELRMIKASLGHMLANFTPGDLYDGSTLS